MSVKTESKTADHYLSLNYRIVTYRDEDGDYIAEAEGLPGCVADGPTAGEAYENMRAAMRSWFESRLEVGLDIYEPEAERGQYSGRLLLRIPKYLHRTLANQASIEGVSLNQYLLARLAEASGTRQFSDGESGAAYTVRRVEGRRTRGDALVETHKKSGRPCGTELDDRCRDENGEIRRKRSDTLVKTLRKEYGEGSASGLRGDATLGEALRKTNATSLSDALKRRR